MKHLLASVASLALIAGAVLVDPPPAHAARPCQDNGFCAQICTGGNGYCTYMDCGGGTEMCFGKLTP